MQEEITIPVHLSKNSEKISFFMTITRFKKSFIANYNSGNVWGCYLTKGGRIAYQDNKSKSFYNIIKK